MDRISLSFDVVSNVDICPLTVRVRLENRLVSEISNFSGPQKVEITLDDSESDHLLEIELRGKTQQHTKIDEQGNIIDDVIVSLKNIKLDDLAMEHTFINHCVYTHDFNGTGSIIADKFAGHMGCNGIVSFAFSTPAYLWLLENL